MDASGFRPMAGRVCVVTGPTSGIGFETAKGLARLGATLVLACRNVEKGERVRRQLEQETGNEDLEVLHLDLVRLASVREFAAKVRERHPALHVLVNNAGIFTAKRALTEDGLESTFETNHVGHFLLTNLLLDRLKAGAPSRIVNVASGVHRFGRIRFDDLNRERWGGFRAYAQSKLANVAFTAELARRLQGSGVTATAMHPGAIRTNFARDSGGVVGFVYRHFGMFLKSTVKGADTVLYLATSPEVDGASGGYYSRRKARKPKAEALDPAVGRRLWEVSERLVGLAPADPS